MCTVEETVEKASEKFTRIVPVEEIRKKWKCLDWGRNGLGDRWAKKKFNYASVFSKKVNYYSEDIDDIVPKELLDEFREKYNGTGILGFYVFSYRRNIIERDINPDIKKKIHNRPCILCGTNGTVCDHKNDLYNDERVLDMKTQIEDDFQPLCIHCNLQKRHICREEKRNGKLYSAKNIEIFKVYDFEFPWEKKVFDINDKDCKKDTYWYDPVEFNKKIYYYSTITIPIIKEIKRKVKLNKLKLIH